MKVHFNAKKAFGFLDVTSELKQRFELVFIKLAEQILSDFDYNNLESLSTEARQKLTTIQPETLAQASRIPGVSPSDINVLLVLAHK